MQNTSTGTLALSCKVVLAARCVEVHLGAYIELIQEL